MSFGYHDSFLKRRFEGFKNILSQTTETVRSSSWRKIVITVQYNISPYFTMFDLLVNWFLAL